MLTKLSTIYKEFPAYMMHLMVEEYKIPKEEIKILEKRATQEGSLILVEKGYYKINYH